MCLGHGVRGGRWAKLGLELLSLATEGLAPRSGISSSDPTPTQSSDRNGFHLSPRSSSVRQGLRGSRPPACLPPPQLLGSSTGRDEALWDHPPLTRAPVNPGVSLSYPLSL